MNKSRLYVVCLALASTGVPQVHAQVTSSAPAGAVAPETSSEPAVARVPRPLAIAGSVVPGLIVHGAGSWLSSDADTAQSLLIAEGVGLGLTGGALTGLALTGAARDWSGLFISSAIVGMGLFTLSFAADVYRAATPTGFGRHPGSVPWMTTEVGLLWLNNPRLDYGPLVQTSATLRWDRLSVALTAGRAPEALHSLTRLEAGYRLWGAPTGRRAAATGGSHLTALFGYENSAYGQAAYATHGGELRVAGRIDSERVLPAVRGAFFEGELGYARRQTSYELFDTAVYDSLLLGGFAFGAYHGDPTTSGGETRIYYDHRHDGYVAGLLMSGLGSGTIGHFGLETTHFFSPTWGVRAHAEIGAAAVFGLHLVARAWSAGGGDVGLVRF
jgi:hypothetical protein